LHGDNGVALFCDVANLIDGQLQVRHFWARIVWHILEDSLQKQSIPLQSCDRRLEEVVPTESARAFVVPRRFEKGIEHTILLLFLLHLETGHREASCVLNVRHLRFSDPVPEDVAKANNPRALLLLAVAELWQ